MVSVVKPWPRLPREVVDAPSLGTFQAWLNRAQSNPVWSKLSLLTARGLDQMASKSPFQPQANLQFCDSLRKAPVLGVALTW